MTDQHTREQALEQVEGVRPLSLQRAILADEVLQYAASPECDSDVWQAYLDQRSSDLFDPSLEEALHEPRPGNDGYLGVRRLQQLLAEDAGPELLGEDTAEEWFDIGERATRDLLLTLRHFHGV